MSDNEFLLVHVKMKLKPEMQQANNKWRCTINGEKRLVLMQTVEFITDTIENAIAGVDQSEIDDIIISTGWKHLKGLKGE